MELYESIRSQQAALIALNPASVVITRNAKVDDGAGGYTSTTTTLVSQDIRIYDKWRYTKVVNISEAGWTVKKTQKAIALYDGNFLAESPTNLDTFTHGGHTYKIVDIKDMTTQGFVCFKELEIEVIV